MTVISAYSSGGEMSGEKCLDIVCTLHPPLSFSDIIQPCRKTEISDLYFHFVIEEQIAKFEITMNDTCFVEEVTGQSYLPDKVATFRLCDGLPSLLELHH